ncbi:hypothetical protein CAXC1_120001 [Candidatus Xenohaliotis californiensis]|uniref:Uncharacterized protein n=2 Tax=Candidatus Xenohaliotis californiensis TaxID=84677 RepID=A0ABP0ERK4_9RICK|nr:hypothetical protein CAXC1_120001 [Candidatus Xenohaliotis californiensis]
MFYCLCNKIYFHKTNEDNCKIDDEVDAALTRGGGLKWQSFDSYDIITFSDTNHKQCSCL